MRELAHKIVHEVSKQENSWTVFVETSLDTSFSSNFDYMSLFNTTTTTTSESNDSASPSSPPLVLSPPSSSPQPQLPSFNSKEDVMLFFKYYDHKTGILPYVFRMHLTVSANLKSIQEQIKKKMKFPPGTDLLFFEEVKITQITPLVNCDISLEQLAHEQLLDGDIYVFQQYAICTQQYVHKMGGHAVIKEPYGNCGVGVYTITNQKELDDFCKHHIIMKNL